MTAVRIRQTRSTTVIQGGAATTKAALSARALQPQTASRITAEDCKDPARLAKVLVDMQGGQQQSTQAARTNPLNAGGVLFLKQAFVGGVTRTLPHNMGRPAVGYLVTRTYSSTGIMTLKDGVLPQGITLSQAIAVVPSQTGTVDVFVF